MAMISGEKLGAALTEAMRLKKVGPKEVAEHFGVKPPSVKDWQSRGCIHKKHLGKLVAYFADVVPDGHWGADQQELSAFNKLSDSKQGISDTYPLSHGANILHVSESIPISRFTHREFLGTITNLAPLITWAKLGVELFKHNDEFDKDSLVPIPTARGVGPRVKWVQVIADHLSPKIIQGDLVALDPDGSPKRDEVTLFSTSDGDFLLMRYRPLPNGHFEAYDASGRTLESARHGIKVAASFAGLFRENV